MLGGTPWNRVHSAQSLRGTLAFHTPPPIFGSHWCCCGRCWCYLPIVRKEKGPRKELVASLVLLQCNVH